MSGSTGSTDAASLSGAARRVLWRCVAPTLRPADRALDRARELVGDASRTVKFLRGRATFTPRPGDVFVASYPRSGTTWLQAIAVLLTSGSEELAFEHISDAAPWWERSLAYRNDAAERFAALPSPRIFKTHLHPGWLPRGAGAIYVEREPADVALSYFHLYRDYLGFAGDLDDFLARFLAGEVQYGRWADHVAAWSGPEAPAPCLRLRYEELRADPVPHIQAIGALLGLEVGPERARAVAEATSFSRMRAAQHKFDHLGEVGRQLGIQPGRFVRRGAVGESNPLLGEDQRRLLRDAGPTSSTRPSLWRLPAFLH